MRKKERKTNKKEEEEPKVQKELKREKKQKKRKEREIETKRNEKIPWRTEHKKVFTSLDVFSLSLKIFLIKSAFSIFGKLLLMNKAFSTQLDEKFEEGGRQEVFEFLFVRLREGMDL